eukprot:8704261-Karenia_brevis.AAC.1
MPSRGARCQGHPVTRWAEDIEMFVKHNQGESINFATLAADREEWAKLQSSYVKYCLEHE